MTSSFQTTGRTHDRPILWSGPGSAFSGKVRSYLIKKGVTFDEYFPSHPRFGQEILPAIGYLVIPVLELNDGTLIQDSTDVIGHFEANLADPPLIPATPLQRATAWLLGFFGTEMFATPGMHYRWSYLDEQRPYLETLFAEIISPHRDKHRQREDIAAPMAMFAGFLPDLGVNADTIAAIEASYEDSLEILDAHFIQYPYLLGGRPSLADFGLMAWFFAHFSRDPHPSTVMKARGPNVFRWTERMNLAGFTDGAFRDMKPEYFADDALCESVEAFLRYLFTDCGPVMVGMLESYNAWVAANPDLPAGTIAHNNPEQPVAHPRLGRYTYELRGAIFDRVEFIDAIYHFQRVLDVIDGLDAAARTRFDDLIKRTGGEALMTLRPARRLASEHYRFLLA